VIDLRTLVPSTTTRCSSVGSGRVVILHEAPRTGGFGGELSAHRRARHDAAGGAVVRVAGFDTPFPYTPSTYLPDARRVEQAPEYVLV
jgi:2-oxoisovalerate dehydrogenase E1 component beta subunit